MKAEKAEISRRIEEVLRIIVDGAEHHDIVQYASEKGWGVGERQLRNYAARANELLARRMERDRDKLLARHISQRRNLYARAVNAADYRTALAVAKDEAALEALYPPKKLAPTAPDGENPPLIQYVEIRQSPSRGDDGTPPDLPETNRRPGGEPVPNG
jgi:hypothetical protein